MATGFNKSAANSGRPTPWEHWNSDPKIPLYILALVQLGTAPFVTRAPTATGITFVATNFALASVIPVWCLVSRQRNAKTVGVIAVLVTGALFSWTEGRGDLSAFLLSVFIATSVATTLTGIHLFWGNFETIRVPRKDSPASREGLTFGIRHLLIASVVVALLCGIFKALMPYLRFQEGVIISVVGTVVAFNTLTAVWALLGRSVAIRLPIAILLSTVASILGNLVSPHDAPIFLLMFGVCSLAVTFELALLRHSGLRFVKKPANERLAQRGP